MAFTKNQLERLNVFPIEGKGRNATIAVDDVLQPCAKEALILKAHSALVKYHEEPLIVPVTLLPVTKLIPTHEAVYPVRLKRLAQQEDIEPAIVWHYKRKYYILSGHHEIVTMMLLGNKKVAVRVVSYA
jgi:hypothetical protein